MRVLRTPIAQSLPDDGLSGWESMFWPLGRTGRIPASEISLEDVGTYTVKLTRKADKAKIPK
jgi:hypothetical protein